VLPPAIVIAVIEEVSDTYLDLSLPFPFDNFLVSGSVLLIGAVFAWFAFRRIDHLTGVLRARNAELEAAGASARALNRVSVAIAAESGIDHVLHAVVSYARELLGADAAVLLLEGPDGRLVLRESDGLPDRADAMPAVEADASDDDAILAFVGPELAVARLSVPLQRGGATIGVLAVASAARRSFDANGVETLASLASQAVIALERDRLEARLRELAVVDERERIARELHDGIAQVLGYVNTKSQAVDGYLEAGRVDEARVQLAELGSAARAVYVDVRESIIGLRGPIEPGQGLGAALAAHARRVAEASRFGLELSIDPATEALRLDPDAEANLYRIVQEALTNVRKHASARRVRLATNLADGTLTVTVADDGRGLPASGAIGDKPGYGLRAMRERASRIGATLQAENQASGGALVRVVLPLAGHEPEAPSTTAPGTASASSASASTAPAAPSPASAA
jgi:signal transduction histidine kinase